MLILFGLVVAFIALAIVIWLISHLVGLIFMLVIAALIGLVVDKVIPGKIPYGLPGAVVFGLLGSLLGSALFSFGPTLWHISIIPAIVGTAILAVGANVVQKATGGKMLGSGDTPKALKRKW